MIEHEIYINGELLDIDEDTIVAITYTMPGFLSADDSYAAYTNTIKVPHTANNDRIFGFASMIESTGRKQYQALDAYVKRNGIEILTGATAHIKSFAKHYSIVLTGNAYGIIASIKGKSIKDIDLSDLDHDREATVIVGDYPAGVRDWRAFRYPLISWGQYATIFKSGEPNDTDIQLTGLYPCVYLSEIMYRIITEAGYRLTRSLGNEKLTSDYPYGELFYNTVIPIVDNLADENTDAQYIQCRGYLNKAVAAMECYYGDYYQFYVPINSFTVYRSWQAVLDDDTHPPKDIAYFEIQSKGKYTIEARATLTGYEDGTHKLLIVVIGSDYDTYDVLVEADFPEVTTSGQVVNTSVEFEGMLGANERIAMMVQLDTLSAPPHSTQVNSGSTTTALRIKASEAEETRYGFNFPMAKNMPDISQSDILKDAAYRFGFMYYVDHAHKLFDIYRIEDVIDRIASSDFVDWSSKLDVSEDHSIEYHNRDYAQRNLIKNKSDSEVQESLGDSYFDIDDATLDAQKEIYTSPFAASNDARWVMSVFPALIERFTYVEGKTNEIQPRILHIFDAEHWDDIDMVATKTDYSYTKTVSSGDNILCAVFGAAPPWDTLSLFFAESLDAYYEKVIALLNTYKELKAWFILNEVDIQTLDPRKPIYVEYFSAYFMILEIMNAAGGKTNVKLINLP